MTGYLRYKNGNVPLKLTVPDTYTVTRREYSPLPKDRIVGIDTESITCGEKLILKYCQLYSHNFETLIDFETVPQQPLDYLFHLLLDTFGTPYDRVSRISQRAKTSNSSNGRHGRRETLQPLVLAFFNMNYDLSRLIDENQKFRTALAYGKDSIKFSYANLTVEIVYSCIGVACPSFQWIIRDEVGKVALRLIGFDDMSYFKSSLASVTQQLQVQNKLDLEEKDLFTRDWNITPPDKLELENFLRYALNDARCHYEIYLAIRELLTQIDRSIIDRLGCIPASAPSASARIMMHMALPEGKNEISWLAPPQWVQQQGLDAYHGAISFCSKPGHVENMAVADISSAYPHVMTLLPDPVTVDYVRVGSYYGKNYCRNLIMSTMREKFGVLTISGYALDSIYPVLVQNFDRQVGVYGPFTRIAATIPEIVSGILTNRLIVTDIHEGCLMVGSNKNSCLKKFVDYLYQLKKNSPKKSPMYELAKLLLNALYGKLIEKRHKYGFIPDILGESGGYQHLILPNIEDADYRKAVEDAYLENGPEDAVVLAESLAECFDYSSFVELKDYLKYDTWETGYYFNSMYAANITGFTRAKLMSAASYLSAYAGDTDSLFFASNGTPDMKGLCSHLTSIGLPTSTSGLGSFELEVTGARGILVKRKVYYLEDAEGRQLKNAHHTISGLSSKQQLYPLLQDLYNSGEIVYTTKPRPSKLREGLRHNRTLGLFTSKDVEVKLTDNPYSVKGSDGVIHWKDYVEVTSIAKL